jgi:F0F1-type ATP synthase delta subunit
MKYSADMYARAFIEAFRDAEAGERKAVIKRFAKVVSKNGDAPRLTLIFKEIEKRIVYANDGHIVDIEFARPLGHKIEAEFTARFSKKDLVKFLQNSALVAGVRMTIDGERECDSSLVRTLNKMFM